MVEKIKLNKQKIIGLLHFILIVSVVSMCCSKNNTFIPPPPPIEEEYWNHFLIDTNVYMNFITNATVADNRLICMVQDGLLFFENMEDGPMFYRTFEAFSVGLDNTPIFFENYVAGMNKNKSDRITFLNYIPEFTQANGLSPYSFGEQFRGWNFVLRTHFQTRFGAINNQGRFVTVITNVGTPVYQPPIGYREHYLVYATLSRDNTNGVWIQDHGLWEIPSMLGSTLSIHDIFAFQDKFYISFHRNEPPDEAPYYVEIESDGSFREFWNPFGDASRIPRVFFEYQDVLFTQLTNKTIWYTHDAVTWHYVFTLDPVMNTFKVIDDYIFVHTYSDIGVITDIFDDVKLYRLPKENRENMPVRSVNKFHDDLVIATHHGIFYKSFDEVMNDKELIFSSTRGYFNLQGE